MIELLQYGGSTVAGAAIAASYLWWRRFKSDQHRDGLDERATRLIDDLNAQVASERVRANEMQQRADHFAGERNHALGEVAGLRKEVEGLRAETRELREHIDMLCSVLDHVLLGAPIPDDRIVSRIVGLQSKVKSASSITEVNT